MRRSFTKREIHVMGAHLFVQMSPKKQPMAPQAPRLVTCSMSSQSNIDPLCLLCCSYRELMLLGFVAFIIFFIVTDPSITDNFVASFEFADFVMFFVGECRHGWCWGVGGAR